MEQAKYLVLDTEATGLHSQKYGLIEIAMAVLDSKLSVIETINWDVKPPDNTEVSHEALEVNNFNLERISKGLSYKKSCNKYYNFVKKHFPKDRPIYVAHFYPFDYAIIESMFMSCGKEVELEEIVRNSSIDTKTLAIMANLKAELLSQPIPFTQTSLSKSGGLADVFELGSFPAHTAMGDVMATIEILKRLVDYVSFEPLTKQNI